MPGIRPLETLHNALSLMQLDGFLGRVTGAANRDSSGGSAGGAVTDSPTPARHAAAIEAAKSVDCSLDAVRRMMAKRDSSKCVA